MTWGDIGRIFAAIVVFSLVAGFVSAWWEERQRDKAKKDRDLP
ncbi:hypothetical protein ES703_114575 [subsurface metagenome]